MAIHDLTAQRLFVDASLRAGARVPLASEQAHYLVNVLRLNVGAALHVFNGRDGEWTAILSAVEKRAAALTIESQTRPQIDGPDLIYAFAPLKRARLDYMVQKATELGVSALQPVITQRTLAERVNLERMRANAIEAAEQCGILRVPEVRSPLKLDILVAGWDRQRALIFCDERSQRGAPIDDLCRVRAGPLAVLIGPEGGFSATEREMLSALPFAHVLSLGPRIMRADTAAVSALALVNATLGDWR